MVKKHRRSMRPRRLRPARLLCLVVVMMVVVALVMMVSGGESRAGKHHQQQNRSKNLFHGSNLAQERRREKMRE